MTSYRDLEIYKISKRLALEIHALSLTLPLSSYMRKAAKYEDRRRVLRQA